MKQVQLGWACSRQTKSIIYKYVYNIYKQLEKNKYTNLEILIKLQARPCCRMPTLNDRITEQQKEREKMS